MQENSFHEDFQRGATAYSGNVIYVSRFFFPPKLAIAINCSVAKKRSASFYGAGVWTE